METSIVVRKPTFALDDTIPHYWYGGLPFATHFLNALSSVFPDGEAFFVRAVCHYRDSVVSPALREEIAAFAAQEGQHSHQHRRHLDMLRNQGYRMIFWRNRLVSRVLLFLNRRFPKYALASTAALEHLTALLARQILSRPDVWATPMDPRFVELWRWHALEEAEHKAVAFDVLRIVAPSRIRRTVAMVMATFGLMMDSMIRTTYMLWVDEQLWNRRVWSDGLRWLLGRGGLLRGYGREYLAWFRVDFHPNEIDDSRLIAAERDRVTGRSGLPLLSPST